MGSRYDDDDRQHCVTKLVQLAPRSCAWADTHSKTDRQTDNCESVELLYPDCGTTTTTTS